MEGYSVTEAASVLGVPTERVWELLARGVLSGAPDGETGMRVFLQPRPAPVTADEPPRTNGHGTAREAEAEAEASPFRELLTEFRNLTERYGQALLALGESRGEVASLRSRVDLLEARMDLRLPMSTPVPTPMTAGAGPAPWPAAPEGVEGPSPASDDRARDASAAAGGQPVGDLDHETEQETERARRRRRTHRATDDFAEALARAEDPSPAELPGAADAAAALAALREETAAADALDVIEASLPRELPAAEPIGVAEQEAEPQPTTDEAPDDVVESESESESEPVSEPQPEPMAPTEPDGAPEPEVPPEPPTQESEARIDVDADVEPAVGAEAAAEPEPEPELAIEPVAPEPEREPAPVAEAVTAAPLQAETEPDTEAEPVATVPSESAAVEPSPDAVVVEADPEPAAEPELEPAASAQPAQELVAAVEPAAEAEPAVSVEPEPVVPAPPEDEPPDEALLEVAAVPDEVPESDATAPAWNPERYSTQIAEPDWWVPDERVGQDAGESTASVPELSPPAIESEDAGDDHPMVEEEPADHVDETVAPSGEEEPESSAEAPDQYRGEETMLWFGRQPEPEAAPAELPDDDAAAEMEVASTGHRPAALPGAQELDDALGALGVRAEPHGDESSAPPAPLPQRSVPPIRYTTAPPIRPPGAAPEGLPHSPASRAYRRLRRIFPG